MNDPWGGEWKSGDYFSAYYIVNNEHGFSREMSHCVLMKSESSEKLLVSVVYGCNHIEGYDFNDILKSREFEIYRA